MRRFFFTLLAMLLLLPAACAEEENRVAAELPALSFTVTDTGLGSGSDLRPHLLAVEITSADGAFSQTVTWASNESPDYDGVAAFVRLVDYNFDGFKDLQLLTAAGARNVFYAVALWDAAQGCFREVTTHCRHLPGGEIEQEITQAEFCNPVFYPDEFNPGFGYIYSVEEDGFRWCTEYVYGWEVRYGYGLATYWVASVYDAGDGLIGESLEQWGTGLCCWWNQVYPEDWYHGEGNASAKRTEARRLLMLGRGTVDGCWMQLANVDWVNLRQQDSKDSPSLAQLDRGTLVQVLATGCGEDGGWVLVMLHADSSSDDDRELDGMTGYIWHSYLESTMMQVANVDWVNVREAPDKQSDVVVTLDAGTLVSAAETVNGWVHVDGWVEAEGFSDTQTYCGYIWHSYLEPEEFVPWEEPETF